MARIGLIGQAGVVLGLLYSRQYTNVSRNLCKIKQHVSKFIRFCSSSQKRLLPARRCDTSIKTNSQSLASDSAIGLYLLQNPVCAQH